MLTTSKVTGNSLRWKEFQAMQPSLYPSDEDRDLLQVRNRPGISGLAGVLGKKLIDFVNYFSTLFDEGLQYRTVQHRSAISAYHNFINGEPIGKHPKICALVTGVFNKRPLQPRYTFFWGVDIVLTYIKIICL